MPLAQLPPFVPRRFVPAGLSLGQWEPIAPLFDRLDARASQCGSAAELERWLLDWGELRAAVDEAGAQRYIAMTGCTADAEAEKAYLDFVEKVEPQLKPRQFKLEQAYLAHPCRRQLPQARFAVFDRNTQQHVALFRPENVPLETEETKLSQRYQKRCGALTVSFRGEERTLTRMARYLEEPDRVLRQETWELVARRRWQEADQFESLFSQMLRLREQIAANAGCPDYREYAFRRRQRFDYTAQDCLDFHAAIAQHVVPLMRELQAQRRRQLQLPALRPWDLKVDPLNRPPLRPFEQIERLATGAQEIFDRLDPVLAAHFKLLRSWELLDLPNRKVKAPGGYQATLAEARLPFIFMNAVGMQRDLETLLHEAGHAFHTLATRTEDFFPYREAPIEFCEVASMSMELLGSQFLAVFYPPEDARRARRQHLEGIVEVFPWIAAVDAFQHWIYTHPDHRPAERTAAWSSLMDRFGGEVDWSGYLEIKGSLWHRQLHIFLHPFYYIEYAIAQLGALQVWANARHNQPAALRAYLQALALGGSRPLPELFAAAGCRFGFTSDILEPLMALVRSELQAATP